MTADTAATHIIGDGGLFVNYENKKRLHPHKPIGESRSFIS